MKRTDNTQQTDEPTTESTRRSVLKRTEDDATSPINLTRRNVMRTTAAAGVAGLGMGAGFAGSAAAGGLDEFQNLTVSDDNRIVNEDGETFKMRGLSIPDPKRLHRTRNLRGKTPTQLVDTVTNNEAGWHPRVIRVPAQPQDIGTRDDGSHHPMGHTGPEYEFGELESPQAVDDDRRKQRPAQPQAFTREELEEYLENYYDPIVERCKERGVYCIVDYHRHWHEQPPGIEEPAYAENHLPYDSEYTNYWAYNSHEMFGEDAPGSWGYVDQKYIEETPGDDYVEGISEGNLEGTPYAYENWTVNQELLDEVLMFWDVVAERYGEMDHVLFEPYNEPTAPGIWGPVEGCGAFKQKPLWDTFLDEFMGPIIEKIREYQSDRVLLVGVPGWCQSVQALHWRNFNDAGYDNIAVTWHNYAGHDVSQMNNWFNDTNYQSPDAVEAETGEDLESPYLPVEDDPYEQECYGWEAYEAAGLQNAMDHHPVAITEFGWINDADVSHWLRGTTTGQGTLPEYGVPFLDQVEGDDRISWVGWCADVRWLPKMFDNPNALEEGELDLVNDNFYDTPFEDIPVGCDELPCEWDLIGGEDSGVYIKQMLEEHKDDTVPFDTRTIGDGDDGGDGNETISVGEYEARDLDDDGRYEDVTGDNETTHGDVNALFQNRNADGVRNNPEKFDFDGNGRFGFSDILELLEKI
ncbi:cellulase family glycosylhydrolase [Natrinema salsiterrestre]|uniref:Glycoside hydrolase family 5 protein n=1 Tax=Natrinema salsiterrestre TaxID=2950540 RepID=A0A9Q4L4R2_9EURY|nr:cellulase family glycosylhydrolase [Natrinema salsiterrestre]MDF9747289.1 glycoside hydrolase family 5 protein [Natrinema salsiterrestre]